MCFRDTFQSRYALKVLRGAVCVDVHRTAFLPASLLFYFLHAVCVCLSVLVSHYWITLSQIRLYVCLGGNISVSGTVRGRCWCHVLPLRDLTIVNAFPTRSVGPELNSLSCLREGQACISNEQQPADKWLFWDWSSLYALDWNCSVVFSTKIIKLSLTTNSLLGTFVSPVGAGKVRTTVWGNALGLSSQCSFIQAGIVQTAAIPLRCSAVSVRWRRVKAAAEQELSSQGGSCRAQAGEKSELCGLGALCRAQGSQGGWWPLGTWWSLSHTQYWLTISYTTILTEQRQTWYEAPWNNSVLLVSVTTILWKNLPSSWIGWPSQELTGELTLPFSSSQDGDGLQKCLKLWDVMEASLIQRQSLISGVFMLLFVSAIQITIERLLLIKG